MDGWMDWKEVNGTVKDGVKKSDDNRDGNERGETSRADAVYGL
jgi:hypothetical protein